MWTDEDTAAYWAEVDREEASDWARVSFRRGGIDPLGWRVQSLSRDGDDPEAMLGVPEHPDAQRPPVSAPGCDYGAIWTRAVSLVPECSRTVLRAATAPGRAGGRGGDGVAIARAMGIGQSVWVTRLQLAEAHLAVVAPWAARRAGQDASGRAWDAGAVVGAAEGLGAAYGATVAAYIDTWSSVRAARAVGASQSTVYARLRRVAATVGPVAAMMAFSGSAADGRRWTWPG